MSDHATWTHMMREPLYGYFIGFTAFGGRSPARA